MQPQSQAPAFPRGWFSIATTDELPIGAVLPRRFQGRDVVAFRTEAGAATVLDAHCPHLGAHLGHGGTVKGETIRCHFHGFCFDAAGTCTETGYGTKPPPTATLRSHPIRELGGLVVAWFDPAGAPPDFEPPALEPGEEWNAPMTSCWTFDGNPQDIAENAVDLGHLLVTHGYVEPHATAELETRGPVLDARYRFTRESPAFRRGPPAHIEIRIHQHGLGLALVESTVLPYGLRTRLLISSTARDERSVDLRTSVIVQRVRRSGSVHPLLAPVPAWLVNGFVRRAALSAFRHDVEQDIPIWRHKKHLERPALAAGDGPIGRYRRWATQFDTDPPAARITPLRTSTSS